jgi:hypothetical protein
MGTRCRCAARARYRGCATVEFGNDAFLRLRAERHAQRDVALVALRRLLFARRALQRNIPRELDRGVKERRHNKKIRSVSSPRSGRTVIARLRLCL